MAATYTTVQWACPDSSQGPSDHALHALRQAASVAKDFDAVYAVKNPDRERAVPLFHADEIIIGKSPSFETATHVEYDLRSVRVVMDFAHGKFGSQVEEARTRFAERSIDGHYSVKYLQHGVMEDEQRGSEAACDLILETKILMNLAAHPNICAIYGVNRVGIDAFLEPGRHGFFIVADRITETLVDRLDAWRARKGYQGAEKRFTQRLEIALDVVSALVFLHDRKLVFNVRPDKVGFDARYGRIKLFNFGQCRQEGSPSQPRSIVASDDITIIAYTAPEVLCKAPTTVSSDVYGLGVMLWEIMSLKVPFEGFDRNLYFAEAVKRNGRPPVNPKWPQDLCVLVESCWDPHCRPTTKIVHETLETALLFADDVPELKNNDRIKTRRSPVHRTASAGPEMQSMQAAVAAIHAASSPPVSPAKTIRSYEAPNKSERKPPTDRHCHSVRTSRTVSGRMMHRRSSNDGSVPRSTQYSPRSTTVATIVEEEQQQQQQPGSGTRPGSFSRELRRAESLKHMQQEDNRAVLLSKYGKVEADETSYDTTPTAPNESFSSGSDTGSPRSLRRTANGRNTSRHTNTSTSGDSGSHSGDRSLVTCNTNAAVASHKDHHDTSAINVPVGGGAITTTSSDDRSSRRTRTIGRMTIRRNRSRTPRRNRARSKSRSKSPGPTHNNKSPHGRKPLPPAVSRRSSSRIARHVEVSLDVQQLQYYSGDDENTETNNNLHDSATFDDHMIKSVIQPTGFDNIQPTGFDNIQATGFDNIGGYANAEAIIQDLVRQHHAETGGNKTSRVKVRLTRKNGGAGRRSSALA